MYKGQVGSIPDGIPLLVVISVRIEGPVDVCIHVYSIKADGQVEDFVVLLRPENLLELYHSILTSHLIVEDVGLTGVRGVLRRDSINNDVYVVRVLLQVNEDVRVHLGAHESDPLTHSVSPRVANDCHIGVVNARLGAGLVHCSLVILVFVNFNG